jgi:hypothetical protein
MQIKGSVLNVSDKQITGNNGQYAKQELTLDCGGEINGRTFDNKLKFTFQNNNCDKLNGLKLHEEVTVDFAPEGRFYEKDGETKHFQILNAWSIKRESASATNASASPSPQPEENTADNLPF